MKPTRATLLFVLLTLVVLTMPSPLAAAEKEETTESAILLLRRAMQVSRDGRHHVLLRALRQLGDPALEPLFSELFQSENPSLKIHGILGLAECSADKKLALVRLAGVERTDVQEEIVSAAMDSELLSDEQARQLYDWPAQGLDNAVKVDVAVQLVKSKQLPSVEPLKEAAKSENIRRRGLALLLLLQSGDDSAMAELDNISKATDSKRDTARELILMTALRYEFDRIAPWAMAVSGESDVNPKLGMQALWVALRFGAPGAGEAWAKQYATDPDISARTRLALIALQASPWLDPKLFAALESSEDPMIKQIAATGAAVASKQDIADAVAALVQFGHPVASNWALGYAKRTATPADAEAILVSLIRAAEAAQPEKTRPQRLDDAVSATQLLSEKSPDAAAAQLKPMLTDTKLDNDLAQAILLGLVRSKGVKPQAAIDGLPPFTDPLTSNIALVLVAKHSETLTPQQLSDLSLVVRGAGVRHDSLRIQAAWTYLKMTDQTKAALAEVTGQK